MTSSVSTAIQCVTLRRSVNCPSANPLRPPPPPVSPADDVTPASERGGWRVGLGAVGTELGGGRVGGRGGGPSSRARLGDRHIKMADVSEAIERKEGLG